jgi:hypothetical protein
VAKHEHERENLLREATALVERAELEVAGYDEPVFVGFRQGGEASVFVGQGRAYHFNFAGELRRAYVHDVLYKSERGRLVALRRARADTEVSLVRHDLTDAESYEFAASLRADLSRLASALQDEQYRVLGQFPEDSRVVNRIAEWLSAIPADLAIAARPGVR